MKHTIETLGNAERRTGWKNIGVLWTLGQAYLYSKEVGNNLPIFPEAIWGCGIEAIPADCRRLGIRKFAISSTFSCLIESIAKFEELGCTLDGILRVKDSYTHFGSSNLNLIPACKITVKEG